MLIGTENAHKDHRMAFACALLDRFNKGKDEILSHIVIDNETCNSNKSTTEGKLWQLYFGTKG